MEKGRLSFKWGGRKLEEQEDGSIVITLNREDVLEAAIQVWMDYKLSEDKREFNLYLSEELGKEREKRLLEELKEMEVKNENKD